MTDRELLYTGLKEFLPEVSEKMIDDLLKFSALLLEKNKVMNLTAVTEPTEVVTRHFLDCAALAPHMPQGGRVLDVGTGAGFPGMPLAILCPETEFVLLEIGREEDPDDPMACMHDCAKCSGCGPSELLKSIPVEEVK